MKRTIVQPEGLDFETPGRRDYFVCFTHPTLWGSHLVPVTVLVGKEAKPGRGVLAIGSTHGNEYEGPVAIKHLVHALKAEDVLGRMILVPVLNIVAFEAGARETPSDGVNMNRAFPGDAKGSITFRIADFVDRFLFRQVHVVLDIHSGGKVCLLPHTTAIHKVKDPEQRRQMEEACRDFGTKFTFLYGHHTGGLLIGRAEELGKITVGTELGWGESVNATGVAMASQGILTAAVRQRQMKGDLPKNAFHPRGDQILVDTEDPASTLLAPFHGHFEPSLPVGESVRKGQLLGYVHDFNRIDEPPFELVAPHDGYYITQPWLSKVFPGQFVAQVGRRVEWAG